MTFKRTHGESSYTGNTPEYRTWKKMIERCGNKNAQNYRYYGGIGVRVCPEWRHDYKAFVACVGRKPSPEHSLDRFPNPKGNYEPGNVRWATRAQQSDNKRNVRYVTVTGEKISVRSMARHLAVAPYYDLYWLLPSRRKRGMALRRARADMNVLLAETVNELRRVQA